MFLSRSIQILPKRPLRFALLLILATATPSYFQTAAQSAPVQDELWLDLEDYRAAQRSHKERGAEADARWRLEWLERISKAAARAPHSPNREAALTVALGLSNSLNDWLRSCNLIEDLLDVTRDDPQSQFRWLTELGEVLSRQSTMSRLPVDRQDAVQAFAAANEVFSRLPAEARATAALREQVILNWSWRGEIQSQDRLDPALQLDAAASFRTARQQLAELQRDAGPPAHRLAGTGFDEHWLLSAEAMALIRGAAYEEASTALQQLSRMKEGRWPAGFYVLEAITFYRPPRDRGVLLGFLEQWLADAPTDHFRCAVKYRLAEAYLQDGNLAEARRRLEDLVENDRDDFRRIEAQAMSEGRGGYYALALGRLREVYLRDNQTEKARQIGEKLARLYPNLPASGK
jgi:tetratricopeptide (TPR) repeat protein